MFQVSGCIFPGFEPETFNLKPTNLKLSLRLRVNNRDSNHVYNFADGTSKL